MCLHIWMHIYIGAFCFETGLNTTVLSKSPSSVQMHVIFHLCCFVARENWSYYKLLYVILNQLSKVWIQDDSKWFPWKKNVGLWYSRLWSERHNLTKSAIHVSNSLRSWYRILAQVVCMILGINQIRYWVRRYFICRWIYIYLWLWLNMHGISLYLMTWTMYEVLILTTNSTCV